MKQQLITRYTQAYHQKITCYIKLRIEKYYIRPCFGDSINCDKSIDFCLS